MASTVPNVLAETASRQAYDTGYYLDPTGQPRSTFRFNSERDASRAQAIADAAGVPDGGRILDYGCGLGTMTAAFNRIGYLAVGVDPSPHAIENALPQARGLVRQLGSTGLSDFPDNSFDLVVAKDVFEHIPEDKLHDLVDDLLCIGRRVLAIIPVVDDNRRFIFDLYENDETHITRLTREEWLGFFPYATVRDCTELTPKIRRADKVAGTLCLLLAETDPQWQEALIRARARSRIPMRPQLFKQLWRSRPFGSVKMQ